MLTVGHDSGGLARLSADGEGEGRGVGAEGELNSDPSSSFHLPRSPLKGYSSCKITQEDTNEMVGDPCSAMECHTSKRAKWGFDYREIHYA